MTIFVTMSGKLYHDYICDNVWNHDENEGNFKHQYIKFIFQSFHISLGYDSQIEKSSNSVEIPNSVMLDKTPVLK